MSITHVKSARARKDGKPDALCEECESKLGVAESEIP